MDKKHYFLKSCAKKTFVLQRCRHLHEDCNIASLFVVFNHLINHACLKNMDLKQSILLDILNVLAITSSFNMKDVCPADNLPCEEPNISGSGLLKFGKCSKIGVLLRYHQLSLLECVKECLITSQCMSMNYRHNWNLCDVVMSVSNSNDMDNDTTCVTSDISTWEKV